MSNKLKPSTAAIHSGQKPDSAEKSRALPIYRTTSFVFENTKDAADLFALKKFGNIYTRLGNPTLSVLENRMAELEGGKAALVFASGTAAIFNTIINICKTGDNIVSANNLYGGTFVQFDAILPNLGINTHFVNVNNPRSFKEAADSSTRAIFIEAIGNPGLDVPDFEAISRIAKELHVPLIVDATFATPALLRPIELGADIVIHSLSKWIGGHGTAIGGIVIDSGKFDWSDPKFTLYNDPDRGYHGLRWGHDLGDLSSMAFILRARTVPLRNLGACLSPDNAWIFTQGLETLHLRMPKHCSNTLAVAKFLEKHPAVNWVRYPGLENDPTHKTAMKYLKNGFGGVVVFGIKGGSDVGSKFIEGLELFSHLANVGDAKSLALHPASTSHSQMSEEQLNESGVTTDLIRLSIGLEDIEDIIADLDQSLLKAIK